MTPSAAQKAVLLDQYPLWLDAVEQAVGRLGVHIVGKTTSADEALALVERHEADVFVAEITVRGSAARGLTCIAHARARVPGIKIIVLSRLDDPRYMKAAFAAGAEAYVLKKTARPVDVALAVRQAFQHSVYFAARHVAEESLEDEEPTETEPTPELTRREIEILRLVAEGYSNAELARMLWVAEQTVKFHLSNVYRKLRVANRTEASRWAQVHGLLPIESQKLDPAAA